MLETYDSERLYIFCLGPLIFLCLDHGPMIVYVFYHVCLNLKEFEGAFHKNSLSFNQKCEIISNSGAGFKLPHFGILTNMQIN